MNWLENLIFISGARRLRRLQRVQRLRMPFDAIFTPRRADALQHAAAAHARANAPLDALFNALLCCTMLSPACRSSLVDDDRNGHAFHIRVRFASIIFCIAPVANAIASALRCGQHISMLA